MNTLKVPVSVYWEGKQVSTCIPHKEYSPRDARGDPVKKRKKSVI